MNDFILLDRVVKRSPLGIRFRDMAYGVNVNDGLTVTATEFGTSRPTFPAVHSPMSGIYGFHRLRGLHAYQDNELPASTWCVDGSPPNWIISVNDNLGRFLPQVLPLCLPKEDVLEVELYSSPSRLPKASYAVVRGELVENPVGASPAKPASWALVAVTEPLGKTYVGVADGRGMFIIFMPYPKPADNPALSDQTWSLTVNVLYQPTTHRWSGQTAPVPQIGEQEEQAKRRIPPDTNTLINQSAATIFDTSGQSDSTLTRILDYRADLILRTQGQSQVWVQPA